MTLREWASRLWGTFRKSRADRDLEEELRLHLELAAEDAHRRGEAPEQAARAARIRAGGTVQAMEALRDQRGLPWLDDLARDLRHACRMLAANPGFTLVSVLSLAIGVGANCAVFSFADTLLLRPLSVPRPAEVLTVGSTSPATIRPILHASYRDYVDVRDRSKSFEGLVAFRDDVVGFASGPNALPRLTIGMLVTANFFPVMAVEPELGRAFRPDEDQVPGRDAVVMLGHDFWQRELGADRSIIGRTIRLNGIECTVIGVTPARFTGLDQYVRYEFYARELYRLRSVVILNVIVSLIASMGMMGLALAIVGLYGLVAYAASRRTKEIGIRIAIGAGLSDVLRMVLGQGFVLAIAGLGAGLLASAGAARALDGIFPGGIGGDGRTDYVAFVLVASAVLVVTLLAAYVPAHRASRVNPTDALRHE